jgi:hypothetical protein
VSSKPGAGQSDPPASGAVNSIVNLGLTDRVLLKHTSAITVSERLTIVQRWRDSVEGTICYIYLPLGTHSPPTASRLKYTMALDGASTMGSISCIAVPGVRCAPCDDVHGRVSATSRHRFGRHRLQFHPQRLHRHLRAHRRARLLLVSSCEEVPSSLPFACSYAISDGLRQLPARYGVCTPLSGFFCSSTA